VIAPSSPSVNFILKLAFIPVISSAQIFLDAACQIR
jgi:hypothetical protein